MKDNSLSNILNQYESKEQIDGQLYTPQFRSYAPCDTGFSRTSLLWMEKGFFTQNKPLDTSTEHLRKFPKEETILRSQLLPTV